jgi:dipeptidyl aminopeptidase/acylaminoacyl peptidase
MVDRSIRDSYGDPGQLIQRINSAGHHVVQALPSPIKKGEMVFLAGKGATPDGNLPFLDCQFLSDMSVQRLWRCDADCLEAVVSISRSDESRTDVLQVLTSFQSPTEPPNLRMREVSVTSLVPIGSVITAVTQFGDPTPQIRGIKKRLVAYQRSDGIQLSATLYLPEDHQPGQRLPLLVWAYPQEFNDRSTAGQVVGNPRRFTRMMGISHLTLVTQGYAVLDNATMPVVGEPEVMNDTFIEQIVDAAQSAIDWAVEAGVADRTRVAVGGHSYGAFMTANLMAHCDLFQAGIARSGAYNRTLTPFGFQAERRSLWEAPEIYLKVSPFMHADKIKRPLLIMHGEKDNNSGTFPMQSERLYQAIKGNGGTARLVILPHESHGYVARQSVMQTQAEMIAWLDRYLKSNP